MKIKNATHWDTLQLRAVFTRVANEMRKTEGKLKWPLTVRVVYKGVARSDYITGRAYLRSGWMKLCVPHPDRHPMPVRRLAFTFMHELLHCYGIDHQRMTASQMEMQGDGDEFAYVDDLKVERKAAKPKLNKPKNDIQITRYSRIMASLQANEAKAKRLAVAHRKLTIKRRYYERALSADGRLALLISSKG